MPYIRKTKDEYQIHGYYAHGWEEVTAEETHKAAKACMGLYQANESGIAFKIVVRRLKK